METTPVWSLIPIAAAAAASLALLMWARRQRWSDPQPEPDPNPQAESAAPPPAIGDFKSALALFINTYRRELALAGVLLVVLIFASRK